MRQPRTERRRRITKLLSVDSVPCPHCGAAEGTICVSPSGVERAAHSARVTYYIATLKDELSMPIVNNESPNIAVMLDLETLSLRPDAYVTQCGVVVGDLETRDILFAPTNYWLTDFGQEHRHKDIDTIRWWMGQDRTTAATVFTPPDDTRRITPETLFDNLCAIMGQFPKASVWASPAMFDLPILMSLFKGKKPWPYYMERDMMTLRNMFDPDKKLKPGFVGQEHNAADDAMHQLQYLFALHAAQRA